MRPGDYDRFSGFDAKFELEVAANGQKRFRGAVCGTENGDTVVIDKDGERLSVPFASIRTAKLVLTDDLIAATERGEI